MATQELYSQLPYTEILDNIDVGIALYDSEGNYLFVNTNLINWRNIPRCEFLKMNVHDFLGVLDVCVFDLVMEKKQRVSRLQYYKGFHNPEGSDSTRMRIVTGTPIFDEFGNIKYVITLLQDVKSFEELYMALLKEHKIVNYGSNIPAVAEKPSIVAKSPAFIQLLSIAANVASLDSTVLLCGESGSGKEVLAHYIHDNSDRKNKPLITVNCAAFPENLIEAELFGYERGAFTGASREGKTGLVEAADKGTLFLDEINSLPLSVQGKLLRTLEEKSIQRIGSTRVKKVDFRLIAATNRNLNEMVQAGTFREDLYYRIQVIPLTIPPMRNRREDIIPLCLHFLHYFCQKYNIQKSFSDSVLNEAQNYDWPGNVREIRNFVERMVVMTPRAAREITLIPPGMLSSSPKPQMPSVSDGSGYSILTAPKIRDSGSPASAYPYSRSSPSREQILEALAACSGYRQQAADYLGISRRTLQYKIKEYHISSRCRYEKGTEN